MAGVAAGGLLVGLRLPASAAAGANGSPLTVWVRVAPDDTVTLLLSQCEIGQGISTTLPAILADELGADWSRVRVENAPVAEAYQNPEAKWMFTGNSDSLHVFAPIMRQAGAAAREMLTQAAAARWKVDAASCRTEAGAVVHTPTGRRLRFGEVAEDAARLRVPPDPKPRPEAELKLVGRAVPRRDVPPKCDGSAVYGLDLRVPGMLYAAVRQAPQFGGSVERFDAKSVSGRPGVVAVVPIPNGVAVVAGHFWQAKTAAEALDVSFAGPPPGFTDAGPNAAPPVPEGGHGATAPAGAAGAPPVRPTDPVGSDALARQYRAALDGDDWAVTSDKGDAAGAVTAAGDRVVTREYESPFQAHATMEPMNCTASVTAEGCEIWAPTQGPNMALVTAQKVLGLPAERVKVNWTLSGGGFGRRLVGDFVAQALLVSKAVGRPVKVVWTREEDTTHDIYRPATLTRLTAALDGAGRPTALHSKLVSASQLQFVSAAPLKANEDPRCTEGLEETRYAIADVRLDFHMPKIAVPTSVLRTTGYGPNLFALEGFIDELAHRAGADPYRYRRALLAHDARALRVLDAAAERAGWGSALPPGHGRGIAFCDAFGTLVAQVVELSVGPGKAVRVHRVTTAADAGRTYDPGIAASNLEGGVAWGLTSALKSEVTFADGRCEQSNFSDYEMLHLWEMPRAVQTVLIDGAPGGRLGGLGEVGPVAVVPAFANALFAATGERVRSVPVSRHGYTAAV